VKASPEADQPESLEDYDWKVITPWGALPAPGSVAGYHAAVFGGTAKVTGTTSLPVIGEANFTGHVPRM